MRALLTVVMAIVMEGTSTAADGQPVTAGRLIVADDPHQLAVAWQTLGACAYGKEPRRVRDALAAPSMRGFGMLWASIDDKTDCILSSLVNRPDGQHRRNVIMFSILRGSLAEAAIKHDHLGDGLQPVLRKADYKVWWSGLGGRPSAIDEMAACVAETAPQDIRALLATEPESGEEKSAIRRLVPYMGPCLVSGGKLSADPQGLRAGLAEALYQRAVAPTLTSTTQVKN